jgi:hypothetical protein
MDDKGFIFTADAVLGLIVVFIITASIVTYAMLPVYQGQDHQHLEALADSALETMEVTGTLRTATVEYSSNNSAQAVTDLQTSLNMLLPYDVGYKITVGNNPPVTDNRGIATSNDVATKVKVISGPQEGWMGRAYYKIEKVNFSTVNQNTTTTVWNFHNYLSNFRPWYDGSHFATYRYWAGSNSNPQNPQNISFSIPTTGSINNVMVLFGSTYDSSTGTIRATNTSFFLNGVLRENIDPNEFLYLFTNNNRRFYNNKSNINTAFFNSGVNNFYLRFNSASSNNNMPWFSILANYTTSLNVAQGVLFADSRFTDIAGVGRPSGSTGLIFNLESGTVTNSPGRTINWNTQSTSDFDVSTPFSLTNIPGKGGSPGSAVASTCNIYVTPNTRLFDAYVVVNAYGAVDGCIVQVKPEGGTWQTIFSSFGGYTGRSDGGYGNLPGIISLHDSYNSSRDYLRAGNNTVRIIVWDDVPGQDYDLVGLENCYSSITYSNMPIRWDTTTFDSYQSTGNTQTQSETFRIESGAENAYLFMGMGLDTRNVQVTVTNASGSSATIYNGASLFSLNLEEYDSTNIFSNLINGTRVLRTGNYTLQVTVTPSEGYESGDFGGSTTGAPVTYGNNANPEIFSGTRIGILYPQFLANMWSASYASNPDTAKAEARAKLIQNLTAQGFSVDQSLIKLEALYSGDVPNAVPVRLELWKR